MLLILGNFPTIYHLHLPRPALPRLSYITTPLLDHRLPSFTFSNLPLHTHIYPNAPAPPLSLALLTWHSGLPWTYPGQYPTFMRLSYSS